ncbi:MAG: phage holin family protein [Hylemonella sp.]
MSEPAKEPGLFASLRQLLGTAVEALQVRLALLSNEIEQEKLRLFDGLLWAGLALLLLGLGALLLCAFIVVLFWDSHRLLALGTLTLLFLGAGIAVLSMARTRLQSPGGLFNSSVAELGRDRAGLDTGE